MAKYTTTTTSRVTIASPERPLDWRWQQAVELADSIRRGTIARPSVDAVVRVAGRFIVARHAGNLERDHERLARQYPGVHAACVFREASNSEVRAMLEANLLAGVPPVRAARKCSLDEEMVLYYWQMFFDVLDRLGCQGFIVAQVLGSRGCATRGGNDLGMFWRWAGWLNGERFLDWIVRRGVARDEIEDADEMPAALSALFDATILSKALLTAPRLDHERDARLVLDAIGRHRVQAQRSERGQVSRESREALSLAEILGQYAVFGGPPEAPSDMPAAELRAAEGFAEACGGKAATRFAPRDLVLPEGTQ